MNRIIPCCFLVVVVVVVVEVVVGGCDGDDDDDDDLWCADTFILQQHDHCAPPSPISRTKIKTSLVHSLNKSHFLRTGKSSGFSL